MVTPLTIDRHIARSAQFGTLQLCRMIRFDHHSERPLVMILRNEDDDHYVALFHESRREGDVWLYRKLAKGVDEETKFGPFVLQIARLETTGHDYRVLISRKGISYVARVEPTTLSEFHAHMPVGYDCEQIIPNGD